MAAARQMIRRAIHWVVRPVEWVCALTLFAMMLLTFVDVFGRYVFSSPVPGAFEITEVLLAVLLFSGLPALTRADGHVVVDLIPFRGGPRLQAIGRGAVNLAVAVMLAFLGYHLWGKASDALQYGESTAVLLIELAPVAFFMSIMTFLSAGVCLARALGVYERLPAAAAEAGEGAP